MPISLKNPRTEQLAREVAQLADETITDAITQALEERLEHLEGPSAGVARSPIELPRPLGESGTNDECRRQKFRGVQSMR